MAHRFIPTSTPAIMNTKVRGERKSMPPTDIKTYTRQDQISSILCQVTRQNVLLISPTTTASTFSGGKTILHCKRGIMCFFVICTVAALYRDYLGLGPAAGRPCPAPGPLLSSSAGSRDTSRIPPAMYIQYF